jgi:hypothetical protein
MMYDGSQDNVPLGFLAAPSLGNAKRCFCVMLRLDLPLICASSAKGFHLVHP